jgi:hypothetical protein
MIEDNLQTGGVHSTFRDDAAGSPVKPRKQPAIDTRSSVLMACLLLQMMGLAPPPQQYEATYRVKANIVDELTEAVYRIRCNQQPDR